MRPCAGHQCIHATTQICKAADVRPSTPIGKSAGSKTLVLRHYPCLLRIPPCDSCFSLGSFLLVMNEDKFCSSACEACQLDHDDHMGSLELRTSDNTGPLSADAECHQDSIRHWERTVLALLGALVPEHFGVTFLYYTLQDVCRAGY